MTYRKLMLLYKHYKNDYDFKLSRTSYCEVDEYVEHDGEFLPD